MTIALQLRRRVASVAATVLTIGLATTPFGPSAAAAPPAPRPAVVPFVPGYPPVVPPTAAVPAALPRLSGSVPVRRVPLAVPGADRGTSRTTTAKISTFSAASTTTATTSVDTQKVGLRALVVAVDSADFGVPAWRTTLDRVGAAYDVLYTRDTPLTAETLVRSDGAGRYNAILLTSSSLLYPDGSGNYISGLDGTEWNTLWTYERDFAVRQVALYSSHGTWPEDYCLRPVSEGGVGDTPLNATLTSAGAAVFDQLRATATIPLVQSYVYRTSVQSGCAATPVLKVGTEVLGVTSTSTDGRERLALTFTSNQNLLHADLLAYGLLRWASRGLYLGEQRHFLNVDVDDWFNSADHRLPDGTFADEPYEVTAAEMMTLTSTLSTLRTRYPQSSAFRASLAYNGGGADLTAPSLCSYGGVEELTATSRCLRNQYRWLNHTLDHPELNSTDYATTRAQIADNLAAGNTLGLPVNATVLKTPEYSGLGVYNPDPDNDVDPPTDFGLAASNPALLTAARDLGVRYLHGNMSFVSHQPSCYNCAIPHPLQPQVLVVPDWPTNIAYHTTTPDEEVTFYNSFYGPNGRFPFFPRDLNYDELMSYETDVALRHLSSGSLYTHTFHIANVHDYGSGRTLLTDWLDRLLAKYSAYYKVPLLSPQWQPLGMYSERRNSHFAQLSAGVDAVYDRTAGTVTVTSPAAGTLTVSGTRGALGASTYGAEVSTVVTLTAGTTITLPAVVRS